MSQALAAFATIFVSVFFAELGDKTQLATVLFAADGQQRAWLVFAAAASALVLSTGLAGMAGVAAERYPAMVPLQFIVGIGFVAIGAWTIWSYFGGR